MLNIEQIAALFQTETATPRTTKAAVLLPLVTINGETHVLFQTRAYTLTKQPGETCFPGGHVESFDQDTAQAAIRECTEELGLDRDDITVLAPLAKIDAPHHQKVIYPYLATIQSVDHITPDPEEVADWFTVPLKHLLASQPHIGHFNVTMEPDADFPINDIANKKAYLYQTYKRSEYFYAYENRIIWGLTARILHHFLVPLRQASASADPL